MQTITLFLHIWLPMKINFPSRKFHRVKQCASYLKMIFLTAVTFFFPNFDSVFNYRLFIFPLPLLYSAIFFSQGSLSLRSIDVLKCLCVPRYTAFYGTIAKHTNHGQQVWWRFSLAVMTMFSALIMMPWFFPRCLCACVSGWVSECMLLLATDAGFAFIP